MRRILIAAVLTLAAAAPAQAALHGTLVPVGNERGHGSVAIVGSGASRTLRLSSDFKAEAVTIHVWLATSAGGARHVDLGAARLSGGQSFNVPRRVSLRRYRHVIIWCTRYSVQVLRARLDR